MSHQEQSPRPAVAAAMTHKSYTLRLAENDQGTPTLHVVLETGEHVEICPAPTLDQVSDAWLADLHEWAKNPRDDLGDLPACDASSPELAEGEDTKLEPEVSPAPAESLAQVVAELGATMVTMEALAERWERDADIALSNSKALTGADAEACRVAHGYLLRCATQLREALEPSKVEVKPT